MSVSQSFVFMGREIIVQQVLINHFGRSGSFETRVFTKRTVASVFSPTRTLRRPLGSIDHGSDVGVTFCALWFVLFDKNYKLFWHCTYMLASTY